MVVSMARWAPPKSGNPSATTSNLRVSAALGSTRSKSRTMTLVVSHRLQSVPPPSQDPNPSAICMVVATSVEWKATPAGTHGQGKREMKRRDTGNKWTTQDLSFSSNQFNFVLFCLSHKPQILQCISFISKIISVFFLFAPSSKIYFCSAPSLPPPFTKKHLLMSFSLPLSCCNLLFSNDFFYFLIPLCPNFFFSFLVLSLLQIFFCALSNCLFLFFLSPTLFLGISFTQIIFVPSPPPLSLLSVDPKGHCSPLPQSKRSYFYSIFFLSRRSLLTFYSPYSLLGFLSPTLSNLTRLKTHTDNHSFSFSHFHSLIFLHFLSPTDILYLTF